MLQLFQKNRMWQKRPLKDRYEVVIVGGGVHGLSTAYYLAKLGVRDVAVLDKGYLGGGASARTTAIIRANYLTPEGVPFFKESVELYEGLATELNFNLLFNQMGRLDLGHNETAVYGLRMRTEINRLLGVDSRMIGPREIKKLVPAMDMRKGKPFPIIAALYHPPCGVIRHDAVVWGYGRGASSYGVELHPFTEVTGIDRTNGSVTGVETDRGLVKANTVVSATAGWTSTLGRMVGPGPANFDPSAASHGHRTAKAFPGQDHFVRQSPRIRLPDRPWRGGHRRWCRSLPKLQPPLHDAAA